MADFTASKVRWLSGILLGIAIVMLILGQTVLAGTLHRRTYIVYWLACFVITGLAAMAAIVDFFLVRRRAQTKQRELMDKAFREMVEAKKRGGL